VYNDTGRSFLQVIFDPRLTDWDAYQGRELSYFFDLIDGRFIAFCIRRKAAHFYAVSSFVFLLLSVFCQQYFIRKLFPRLGTFVPLLFSLFYMLDSSVANYRCFRSAKPGAAFCITAVLFFTLTIYRLKKNEWQNWFAVGGLLLGAALFDRQGYIFAAAYTGLALSAVLICRDRELAFWRNCTVTGTSANAAAAVYNLWLAPALIGKFNGYYPDFSYQSLGGCSEPFRISAGFRMVTEHFGHAFTGTAGSAGTAAGVVLILFLLWRIWNGRGGGRQVLFFAGGVAGMVAVATVMIARHPEAYNVLYGIYNLVFFTILMFFMIVAAGMEKNLQTGRRWSAILLSAGIIFTLCFSAPWKKMGDPEDMRVMATQQLIRTLNNGGRGEEEKRPLPFPMYKLAEYFSRDCR